MNDRLLAITRWTNRPPHPNFIKMMRDAHKWLATPSQTNLTVAVHGDEDLDQHVLSFMQVGGIVLDFRGETDNRQSRVTAEVLKPFSEEYGFVGVLDDDAYIRDKAEFEDGCCICEDHQAACYGPVNSYMWWRDYKSKHDRYPDRHTLVQDTAAFFGKNTNSTVGCQMYRSAWLKATQDVWYPRIHQGAWMQDTFMGMLATHSQYNRMAFLCKGYNHEGSHGKAASHNMAWYEARVRAIWLDYQMFQEAVSRKEMSGEFMLRVMKSVTSAYDNMRGELPPDLWSQVPETVEDAFRYCDII